MLTTAQTLDLANPTATPLSYPMVFAVSSSHPHMYRLVLSKASLFFLLGARENRIVRGMCVKTHVGVITILLGFQDCNSGLGQLDPALLVV